MAKVCTSDRQHGSIRVHDKFCWQCGAPTVDMELVCTQCGKPFQETAWKQELEAEAKVLLHSQPAYPSPGGLDSKVASDRELETGECDDGSNEDQS